MKEFDMAAKEIFKYKELLKDIVTVSMNVPDVYLEKLYAIYSEFVDLVSSFSPFTIDDVQTFLDEGLVRYSGSPFFPVLSGLFINALLNKLFEAEDALVLDLDKLVSEVVDDAESQTQMPMMEMAEEGTEDENEGSSGFS
jgi:hypothetical protein